MHGSSTGIVNNARKPTEKVPQIQNPAATPNPRGHREIDQGGPDTNKDHPGAELCAVRDGTGNQSDRNDRKGCAEGCAKQPFVIKPGKTESTERIAGELGSATHTRHAPAVENPEHPDECESTETHHHHADDALSLD